MEIKKISKIDSKSHVAFVVNTEKELDNTFTKDELSYIKTQIKDENKLIVINRLSKFVFVVFTDKGNDYKAYQVARKAASKLVEKANELKIKDLIISSTTSTIVAFIEALLLTNYQFLKYYTEKKENSLKNVGLVAKITASELSEIVTVATATNIAKDLVNEPVSYLNATQLANEAKKLGKEAGFKVEVLSKSKIEALKMGGLLAVNKGSLDQPTFSILEWKPAKAKNKKPIILVGKGVVYDTGGLSLKPTPNSMDMMKCDMAGAAAIMGVLYAIAKNKLPYHVIGLIPATDNRPGGNAYAPGDVVTMHNKKTVEVLNTDAEGRMILADALSYAARYNPQAMVDAATLTGACVVALGSITTGLMGNDDSLKSRLKKSAENTGEYVCELPLYEEYEDQIKSDYADVKNSGGRAAGTITAALFLRKFIGDYPWAHLDIAGTGMLDAPTELNPKGGSGVGVRLLSDMLKNW